VIDIKGRLLKEMEFKEKLFNSLIIFFGILTIAGFTISLFFLARMTGGVIGILNENIYGAIVIISFFLALCIVILLRFSSKDRRKKEVDIKEIIEEVGG
jgi:hypothetical protein